MEHFGICEREEGDGNNSAFTLVLPKENQGESESKLCTGCFFNWYPPKSSKYKKVNQG